MTLIHNQMIRLASSLFALGLGIGALTGCETVYGSGRSETQERDVQAFTKVEVSAGLEAHVTQGATQSVVITGDDNIVPTISTEVRNGVLFIEPAVDFDPRLPLEIEVVAPSLEGASLRAGGALWIDGLDAPTFELSCEAGGEVMASGHVDRLTVSLSAGGDIDAVDIDSPRVVLRGEAGGEMSVTATDRVEGHVESGATARVFGDPEVRSVTTESGGEVEYVSTP
ncbi:MAG: head GIN domain-containing protein [Polyangiaceae bacterium]